MGLFSEKTTAGFGEHLRREREMRGVSLDEISAATRISTRFLQALENDQWNQLPGGVFNRGFIRSVARYLGLDEEALLSEYALVTKEQPLIAPVAEPPSRAEASRLPWILGLAAVVLAGAVWLAWRELWPLVHAYRNPPQAPPALAAPPPADQAKAAEEAANPEKLQLKVDVGQATTLKVTADGQVLFDGRMKPGESKTFEAKTGFEVSAGNARTVVLEMNGQLMPAVGSEETSGSIKLDRKDLKRSDGGIH